MKYIVIVGDGMADYPIKELNGRTPLEVARKPNLDFIACHGILGRIKTIPDKMSAGSDVAIISILGYDPLKYYTGRGPLEAANLGIELNKEELAFRCNLVTVNRDTMVDYSAGHITSKEASILIDFLNKKLGSDKIRFYPGVSYRNIMVIDSNLAKGLDNLSCKAPHDIMGMSISKNLPKGEGAELIIDLMRKSKSLLEAHEINMIRIDLKENPANMIWLWGQGRTPEFISFEEKYGLSGAVISAVDLIKGLGKILGLEVIRVPGATGYYDTDYKGKAEAALKVLKDKDFVFIHIEAPDEAGHNADLREKITAIERIDSLVLGTVLKAFKRKKNFRILILPDHATPLSLRTHTKDDVFFAIYGKDISGKGFKGYNEVEARKSQIYYKEGYLLMEAFIKGDFI
ncbi:MAG: cofactor-independent phosphoglycerate mutase [Candidatus Omnitrophica bacterium]|nr:cofactor-independent phosphoglycerate mutase [Candidatus Omnitrophota bacterium]MCM8799287.1 cofactor-independent phosphoglycerate mutase [Candidatus Omnitrophota bacterium]